MKNFFVNKKHRYSILAGAALLVVIIIVVGFNWAEKKPSQAIADLAVKEARAQSYAATGAPALKDNDNVFGSASAPFMIFVYEDYTNPFSAVLADNLEKVRLEADGRLAIVIRPFFQNSSAALKAAAAVSCAGEQGKWIEMRALLFAQTKTKQPLASDFTEYAKRLDLNEENFASCLTNVQKSGKIEQSVKEAGNYSVQGAPTIFIGDEMILGARPYEDFVDSNGDRIEGLKSLVARKIK